MELIVVIARVALAVTFLISAAAKLRDHAGARQAVIDFGVPTGLAAAIAVVLAPLEIASAVLFLTTGTGVVIGAALAVSLLAAFTAGIAYNLLRGNRVECHCFGALSTKPLSWWSVARNVALIALGVLVLSGGTSQGFVWSEISDVFDDLSSTEVWLTIGVLALAAAVVALGYLFLSLLQRYGSVLVRLEALEAGGGHGYGHGHGAEFAAWGAPALTMRDAADNELELEDVLVTNRASMFVFVSPHCAGCAEMVGELQQWQGDESGPSIVVLSTGEREAIAEKFGDVLVYAHEQSVIDDYRMEYTPGAVAVSSDGFITSPPSYGADDVRRLYQTLSGRGPSDIEIGPPPVREGDPAPDVEIELDGERMPIAAAAGEDSVLLFWDTTCGFCEQITEDVARRQDSVPLLLVLRGNDVDTVRESGLTSPIAVDPSFAVGNALQAPGTPVAVRLRDGKVASTVAVGGPEVLDLLAAVRVIG